MTKKHNRGNVFILSLGCAKNRVDSEVMLGHLVADGWTPVAEAEQADALIVNTCGFIADAKEESVDAILEMGRLRTQGRAHSLVVTGCLSQLFAPELQREVPEIDAFLGTGNFESIARVLAKRCRPAAPPSAKRVRGRRPNALERSAPPAPPVIPDPDFTLTSASPRVLSLPYSAYVKVAEGCSNLCTFCIVPRVRGPQRSRSIRDVVREVEGLLERGVVEVNLIAQDLCAFGKDQKSGESLAELLRALDALGGASARHWIRCLYAYPRGLTRRVIDAIGAAQHIVPYIDMPLQHISDSILRRMRRGTGGAATWELVRRLRRDIPSLVLRTTFITGFPGETEADFKELMSFVRESRFERMGVFTFSPEEGTAAAAMPNQVPAEVASARRTKLLELQRKISREQHEELIGETVEVLVEGVSSETDLLLVGRHRGQAPEVDGVTYINDGTASPGELALVQIDQAGDYDLVGGIVGRVP